MCIRDRRRAEPRIDWKSTPAYRLGGCMQVIEFPLPISLFVILNTSSLYRSTHMHVRAHSRGLIPSVVVVIVSSAPSPGLNCWSRLKEIRSEQKFCTTVEKVLIHLERRRSSTTINPVSYTHLDVYKRQAKDPERINKFNSKIIVFKTLLIKII